MALDIKAAINMSTGKAYLQFNSPSKNPFQCKQWIRATATIKSATFTERAVVETEMYFLPFMDTVQRAQARWPGKRISYTTLPVAAAQKTPNEATRKKAE